MSFILNQLKTLFSRNNLRVIKIALGLFVLIIVQGNGCGQKSKLTLEELSSISDSGGSSSSEDKKFDPGLYSPSELFTCNDGQDPAPTRVRRLTRYEYLNIMNSIFSKYLMAEVRSKYDVLPYDNDYLNFDNTEHSVSTEAVDGFLEFSYAVASRVELSKSYQGRVAAECLLSTSTAPITDSCVNGFLNNLGLKTFRRPLTAEELASYREFYRSFSDRKEAFRSLFVTILNAPQFLYRLEDQGTPVDGREDLLELSSYEIASRLSFLFLGRQPDGTLFSAAANGSLKTREGLEAQVDRLLNSETAKTHIRHFYTQWLDLKFDFAEAYSLGFLNGVALKKYRSDAPNEVKWFVNYIMWDKKGNVTDLLTDRTTYVADYTMSGLYGVPLSGSPQQLPADQRSGILTRAAMLANGEDATHPFRRGSLIMGRYMCQTPPRPDEEGLPEGALQEPPIDGTMSTRDRFEYKTQGQVCMSCHSILNPLGFALESYDSIGRYRTVEKIYEDGKKIGEVPVNTVVDYVYDQQKARVNNAIELSEKLAENPRTHQCAARQWYRFSYGQAESPQASCELDNMYRSLVKANGSFYEMFRETALNPKFLLKKVGQ